MVMGVAMLMVVYDEWAAYSRSAAGVRRLAAAWMVKQET